MPFLPQVRGDWRRRGGGAERARGDGVGRATSLPGHGVPVQEARRLDGRPQAVRGRRRLCRRRQG